MEVTLFFFISSVCIISSSLHFMALHLIRISQNDIGSAINNTLVNSSHGYVTTTTVPLLAPVCNVHVRFFASVISSHVTLMHLQFQSWTTLPNDEVLTNVNFISREYDKSWTLNIIFHTAPWRWSLLFENWLWLGKTFHRWKKNGWEKMNIGKKYVGEKKLKEKFRRKKSRANRLKEKFGRKKLKKNSVKRNWKKNSGEKFDRKTGANKAFVKVSLFRIKKSGI